MIHNLKSHPYIFIHEFGKQSLYYSSMGEWREYLDWCVVLKRKIIKVDPLRRQLSATVKFSLIFLWIDPPTLTSTNYPAMATLASLNFDINVKKCNILVFIIFSFPECWWTWVESLKQFFFSLKNGLTWCKIHRFISTTYLETLSIGKILQNLTFPALYCCIFCLKISLFVFLRQKYTEFVKIYIFLIELLCISTSSCQYFLFMTLEP